MKLNVSELTLQRIVAIINCRNDLGAETTLNILSNCLLDEGLAECDESGRLVASTD